MLPFDSAKVKSHVGREVILGLRPERITDARGAHGDDAKLQPVEVKVDVIEPTGPTRSCSRRSTASAW